MHWNKIKVFTLESDPHFFIIFLFFFKMEVCFGEKLDKILDVAKMCVERKRLLISYRFSYSFPKAVWGIID